MTSDTPWTDMPTVELVRMAQTGTDRAQEELFGRYVSRVLEVVRIRLGPRLRGHLDSMDITQEVLGEAFVGLKGFEMRDESSLMRWMARIAENRIRNQAAFQNAAKRDSGRVVPLDGSDSESSRRIDVPDRLPTPSVEMDRAEQAERVRNAISELPKRYREVILLRDYTQAKWEDVATALDVNSADAARMLYSRALSKLSESMGREG